MMCQRRGVEDFSSRSHSADSSILFSLNHALL